MRVRVHLYERGFRQKPDSRVLVDEVDAGMAHDIGSALRSVMDEARSAGRQRHASGRERPPKTRLGTVIGGWQRGSLTPQMPPSPLLTAAPTATRAAKSAARLTVVKLLITRDIATSPPDAITFLSRLVDQRTAREHGGPLLPSLCSPLLFFAFVNSTSIRRRESSRRETRPRSPDDRTRERGTQRLWLADLDVHFHRSPCRVAQRLGKIPGFQIGIRIENGRSAVPLRKQADDGSHRHSHAANTRPSAHDPIVASDARESWHGTHPTTLSTGRHSPRCAATVRVEQLPGARAREGIESCDNCRQVRLLGQVARQRERAFARDPELRLAFGVKP